MRNDLHANVADGEKPLLNQAAGQFGNSTRAKQKKPGRATTFEISCYDLAIQNRLVRRSTKFATSTLLRPILA